MSADSPVTAAMPGLMLVEVRLHGKRHAFSAPAPGAIPDDEYARHLAYLLNKAIREVACP